MVKTKPLKEGKLSKGFLYSLDAGTFLVSNCCYSPGLPIIQETVPAEEDRAKLWEKIKEVNADRRLSSVFRDRGHWERFMSDFGRETHGESFAA